MDNLVSKNNIQTERRFHNSFGFWFGVGIILIVTEQLTKVFAAQRWPVFLNDNFAFSIPLPTPLMYIIYVLVLVIVLKIVFKQWGELSLLAKFGWTLVLAGGVSNIGERIVLGHVRDFIYFANGVFNLADGYIVLGLLIIVFTFPKKNLS